MDPLAVLKTMWHHKLIVLPVLLITLIAGVYVFQFAPRSYQTTMTYALINPSPPSQADIEKKPDLGKLNSNNPYLRSSDPSLIVQVVITRLSDGSTGDQLAKEGLGSDYTVSRGVGGQNGFLIDITGIGSSPEASNVLVRKLGAYLEQDLSEIQKVNGADSAYLYTPLVVAPPDKPVEQFSSRLRSLIVVLLGGIVLMFAAVSFARALDAARMRKSEVSRPGRDDPEYFHDMDESVGSAAPSPGHDVSSVLDAPHRARRRQGSGINAEKPGLPKVAVSRDGTGR